MTFPAPSPDTTAIVTGASSGIGIAIARELASRGYGVTLVARREDKLRQLEAELASTGVRVEFAVADLSREADRNRLIESLNEHGLSIGALVNNAGIGTSGAVHTSQPTQDLAMIRTNVEAVAHLCSLVLPGMVKRRAGAILNVASTAAFQPVPGQAGYGATKAFVLSYTHAIRAELAGTGVTATTLCPGPVQTGFGETAGISDEEAQVLPKVMWLTAEQVAKQGVDAMIAGKAVVIPGVANRIGAAVADITPRGVLARILAKQHPSLNK